MAIKNKSNYSNSPYDPDNPWEIDTIIDTDETGNDIIPLELPTSYHLFRKFRFTPFYYPYTDLLVQQFNRFGIDGILRPEGKTPADKAMTLQKGLKGSFAFNFDKTYKPNKKTVLKPFPKENFDFSFGGAYSEYNWELFFHNPILVAERLSQNQKFEDAQRWYHYVFDPTISYNPDDYDELNNPELTTQEKAELEEQLKKSRYWRLKPFFNFSKEPNIARFLSEISRNPDDPNVRDLNKQLDAWKENPFKPHLIAKMRVVSYMKYTVMKYLDNLIAWGDSLFRQDTMESINEATQVYLLASSILGEKPQKVSRKDVETESFNSLFESPGGFDEFSNAFVELENVLTGSPTLGNSRYNNSGGLGSINILFFCIPSNKKMEGYWDIVADRLFKIRNCQNIDGVERQLALFAPVIDPLALVIAAGRGGSFLDAVRNLNAPLPPYRFNYMLQRALELTGEVRNLGAALLSALEKKDAEMISGIRNRHEIKVLESLRNARKLAVDEANQAIRTLAQSKDSIHFRFNYYNSRKYVNAEEKQQRDKLKEALDIEQGLAKKETLIGVLEAIPAISFGVNGALGTPHFATRIDSKTLTGIMSASLRMVRALAQKERFKANKASIKGGYNRRRDDWKFQAESAKIELRQIDEQIRGAHHRREIALYEFEHNEKQVQNAQEIAEVMETKYTNKELYSWMVTEISKLYFKSYQLAYDVAKMAERCYQFERPESTKLFINNFNWNSLKKGLLAGDYLNDNLRRMQQEFEKTNDRKLEINKNISLAMIDPDALIELRTKGKCTFDIPEVLFDLDFPGHYRRRIKTVSISIPSVIGPNGNVPAKLSLLNNLVRKDIQNGAYTNDSANYTVGRAGTQAIATSTANRDSGLFELNFNDQRYLPFEGAGVISGWNLDLPDPKISQFDYHTISDVILHIAYEAEEAGNKDAVETAIKNSMNQIVIDNGMPNTEDWSNLISMKQQFSAAFFKLLDDESSDLFINDSHFSYLFKDKTRALTNIELIIIPKGGVDWSSNAPNPTFTLDDGANPSQTITPALFEDTLKGSISGNAESIDIESLTLTKADGSVAIAKEEIDDIFIKIDFSLDPIS